LIGNVSMDPNHLFPMGCRIRVWSGDTSSYDA
jgi:hypothetical protein